MSLLPLLFDEPPYSSYWLRPSRILDQHFGLGLDSDDLLQPLNLNNRILSRTPAGYLRNWRPNASEKDSGSLVSFDKDKFQANLDVSQFKPEEISVKVADNVLTIEGKHEEKQDEHGYISRHFVRRYVLPKNYDVEKIQSKLSSDGVLSITAPPVQSSEVEHKNIPITQTGEPAKQIEQKKQ
ncbi:protein lethal(2)essential for life-like [Cylas formicarius]|uniref:protein lethal(2)essential for life-like n=1 Tax=Cylas formicarius TaxID=197179 RepID=UPI002958CF4A|nr:protein lethal(2)essential for life-like [Cylas formicarius]